MGGAGGGLEESGIDVGKVLDLEDSASWIENLSQYSRARGVLWISYLLTGVGAVFGKTAVHGDTVGLEVLTE